MNDILLAKAEIIERTLARVEAAYATHADKLENNYDAQDVIVLNLQRACEASIDMAMHLVRINALGLPKTSAEAFTMLERAEIIPLALADRMRKMVGFRNIVVHDYRALDWNILRNIVQHDLADMRTFASKLVRDFGG